MLVLSIIGSAISIAFFRDAQKEIAKNRPSGHPDYGKGEFWLLVFGLFSVLSIGRLIWDIVIWFSQF
jgi:hypothetical protein